MNHETCGRRLFLASLAAGASSLAIAQQTAPYVPKQSDRPEAIEGDEPGFASIFDGNTLSGWEGDRKYWRAADGIMTGEITPETVIRSNTFLIWRGGSPEDFELKVDYRISAGGNSGINYRSVVVNDKVTPSNKFAMRGYQFDIDGRNQYTGNNYEEKGRLFLAQRGEMTHVTGTRKPVLLQRLGDNREMTHLINDGWNSIYLVVRGNTLIHCLNGQVMSIALDDDPARERKGLLGVQVHVGPPMKIEYRNWRIRIRAGA